MTSTLHVVGFPHTHTNNTYATCAYTQKLRKFCKMMTGHGRRVVLYSGEENDTVCDEHVPLFTEAERLEWFGAHDENDIYRGGMAWDPDLPYWRTMNARAARAIEARIGDHRDLLCLIMGRSQEDISVRVPQLNVCEIGVGYEGIIPSRRGRGAAPFFAASFCAFESHAHRNFVYGLNGWRQPRYMLDTVIPNYFDPDEFTFAERDDRDGYALFLGRVVEQKGPHIAAQIAQAAGLPLLVAGPGGIEVGGDGWHGWVQSPEVRVEPCRYVGPLGVRARALCLAGARVLIAPTTYSEPFGGVAVEAMMSGTPVVTFPTGAFVETVQPGVSGYHFHTVAEGVRAVRDALELDHHRIRDYAMSRYSLDAVRPLYLDWFDRVDGLWAGGWDAPA